MTSAHALLAIPAQKALPAYHSTLVGLLDVAWPAFTIGISEVLPQTRGSVGTGSAKFYGTKKANSDGFSFDA